MSATLAGEQAGGHAMAGDTSGSGDSGDGDEGPKPDSEGVYFLSVEDFEWRPDRDPQTASSDPLADESEATAKSDKEQRSS
jgi:hypothetical protein